jgi:hypothetical protein
MEKNSSRSAGCRAFASCPRQFYANRPHAQGRQVLQGVWGFIFVQLFVSIRNSSHPA